MQKIKILRHPLLGEPAHFGFCPPKFCFFRGLGGSPNFFFFIGIFVFLWVRTPCKKNKILLALLSPACFPKCVILLESNNCKYPLTKLSNLLQFASSALCVGNGVEYQDNWVYQFCISCNWAISAALAQPPSSYSTVAGQAKWSVWQSSDERVGTGTLVSQRDFSGGCGPSEIVSLGAWDLACDLMPWFLIDWKHLRELNQFQERF